MEDNNDDLGMDMEEENEMDRHQDLSDDEDEDKGPKDKSGDEKKRKSKVVLSEDEDEKGKGKSVEREKQESKAKPKGGKLMPSRPVSKDIFGFVTLQTAHGYFEITKDFEGFLNLSRNDIMGHIPQEISSLDLEDNVKETIWVTILALAFMEKNYSDMEDEWSLIADKSTKYIKKTLSGRNINIQELKEVAKSLM